MSDAGLSNYERTGPLAARGAFNARHATRSWFGWVAERMPGAPAGAVLDTGCGPGWLWAEARGKAAAGRLVLIDRSPAMVAAAMARLAPLAPVGAVADIAALPLADARFATVMAGHVLYHAADPARAVAELDRVRAPGGTMIVTTIGEADMPEVRALMRRVFGRDPGDATLARFGARRAEAILGERFPDLRHHVFTDDYVIEDADMLAGYLLSMPPGTGLDAAGRGRVHDAVAEALAAAGGRIVTRRVQSLFAMRGPN